MISIQLPEDNEIQIDHAVFDYNGTLAADGCISEETKEKLVELAKKVHVVVVTADTFGRVKDQLGSITEIELVIMEKGHKGGFKAEVVTKLGAKTLVVGNGVNDRKMFETAPLSICVVGKEGASGKTLALADIVVTRPEDALDLLLNDKRMIATLRR